LRFDDVGDGWQPSVRPGGSPDRWPREGLLGSGRIADADLPCITAELQIRWHIYPELDDVDWQDARLLSDRFGLELPDELQVRPGFVSPKRAPTLLN
jgi:hypothetical protein